MRENRSNSNPEALAGFEVEEHSVLNPLQKDVIRFIRNQPVSTDKNRKTIEGWPDDYKKVFLGEILAKLYGTSERGVKLLRFEDAKNVPEDLLEYFNKK